MTEMTYCQLGEILHSLGFSVRVTADPQAIVYEHETGALVALPIFQEGKKVLPRHLVAVRAMLEAYRFADPTRFAPQLPSA